MPRWIRYFNENKEPNTLTVTVGGRHFQQALGSDSLLAIDGRYGPRRMHEVAFLHAWQLRYVQQYAAYQVWAGRSLLYSKPTGPVLPFREVPFGKKVTKEGTAQ